MCSSGLVQLGQALDSFFGGDLQNQCTQIKYSVYGIVGIAIIGIVLVIVGAVVPSGEQALICEYCNYATTTKTDLINHKNDKHLEKVSPYVCEHCDYIGTTEEELWDHYNDKHPESKKW